MMFARELRRRLDLGRGGALGLTNRDHQLRLLPGEFAPANTTAPLSYFCEILAHLAGKDYPFTLH